MAKDRDDQRSSRSSYTGLGIRDTVRARPVASAAVATVAAAAGAYLWSRRGGDQPLMKWGQQDSGERAPETAGASTGASATASRTRSAKGGSGIDRTARDQTKAGSIAY